MHHTRDTGPEPKAARRSALPEGTLPRGLSREQAAAYVGVGSTLFNIMVVDGRMPKPKCINTRKVWDRHQLDAAFEALPDENERDDVWDRQAL